MQQSADFALASFVKAILKIHSSRQLATLVEDNGVAEAIPNYKVNAQSHNKRATHARYLEILRPWPS